MWTRKPRPVELSRLIAPTLILLVGAAARITPLTDNRFHPDEALYASFGRLISTFDWNLSSRLVDKPPLAFYLMAGAFQRIGPNEVAARFPNLAVSLLSLALVWRLAMRLWGGRRAALLAMLFYALSPMAVLFAPTAFTDPLLVLWVLAALVAVTGGRWGWGGLFFGLALVTKQTALFFLPLVWGAGLLCDAGAERPLDWPAWRARLGRFGLPVVVVAGLLVAWDASRGPVEGFWRAGVLNNDPGRFIRPDEALPRLRAWLGWLAAVGGWPPMNLALGVSWLGVLGCALRQRRRSRYTWLDLGLAGYVLVYLVFYWGVAFNIFDRYLLPLVPLLALLLGRAVMLVLPRRGALAALALVALMAVPALRAARSAYPVGGDHGAYDGIDDVAAYLDGLPSGTVIYDHWLGWSLDFYLFDSPAYTTYFATPAELEAMLQKQDDTQNAVLLVPVWESGDAVLSAVTGAGFEARPAYETVNRLGTPNLRVFSLARPTPGSNE